MVRRNDMKSEANAIERQARSRITLGMVRWIEVSFVGMHPNTNNSIHKHARYEQSCTHCKKGGAHHHNVVPAVHNNRI